MILFADSEGPDQTAHPRSLIRAFAVRTWTESNFHLIGLKYCLMSFCETYAKQINVRVHWASTWENVPSDVFVQRRLKLACAFSRSDQSLRCPHEETFILGYPKCAQWRFWSDCANAQADLNLRWAHMSEGTFSGVEVPLFFSTTQGHHMPKLTECHINLCNVWWKNTFIFYNTCMLTKNCAPTHSDQDPHLSSTES